MAASFVSFPCPMCQCSAWNKSLRFKPVLIAACFLGGAGVVIYVADVICEWLFNSGIWPKYNKCARCGFETRERRIA